jgi:hypothetical protein
VRQKKVGLFEIDTYPDSDTVSIKYHHNDSVFDTITFRNAQDLHDLEYALACVKRERADRNR